MNFVDAKINEMLNNELEQSAYEMATTTKNARAYTFLEHFLKLAFYPTHNSRDVWLKELAVRTSECARLKNTATNKKFPENIYSLLFTTYCSSPQELEENAEAFYKDFISEGYGQAKGFEKVDFSDLFDKMNILANKLLPLMTQSRLLSVDEYKNIIKEII